MKKIAFVLALVSMGASASELWYLVDSRFTGSFWLCTYRLSGGNLPYQSPVEMTVTQNRPCSSSIVR